ncbi:unnamed protein product [Adineta ricciae]|nr:unnamed protein product [Adineta ricciae]
MKNFQHTNYGRSLLAYCDSCYAVLDAEKQIYYQCLTCNNYTVCSNCISYVRIKHLPYHQFIPRIGIPKEMMWINMNIGITCDVCFQVNFPGHRYRCVDCPDFDVCQRCCPIALRTHRLKLECNPQKAQINRYLLAQRAICVLTDPTSPLYKQPRDHLTGWSLDEARFILTQQQTSNSSQTTSVPTQDLFQPPTTTQQHTNTIQEDKQNKYEEDLEEVEEIDNDESVHSDVDEDQIEIEENRWQDVMRQLEFIRRRNKKSEDTTTDDCQDGSKHRN